MWSAINYSSEEEKEKGNKGSKLMSFHTAKTKLAYCRDYSSFLSTFAIVTQRSSIIPFFLSRKPPLIYHARAR